MPESFHGASRRSRDPVGTCSKLGNSSRFRTRESDQGFDLACGTRRKFAALGSAEVRWGIRKARDQTHRSDSRDSGLVYWSVALYSSCLLGLDLRFKANAWIEWTRTCFNASRFEYAHPAQFGWSRLFITKPGRRAVSRVS